LWDSGRHQSADVGVLPEGAAGPANAAGPNGNAAFAGDADAGDFAGDAVFGGEDGAGCDGGACALCDGLPGGLLARA